MKSCIKTSTKKTESCPKTESCIKTKSCLKTKKSKSKSPSTKKSGMKRVSFNDTVLSVRLPGTLHWAWDNRLTLDWGKIEKRMRYSREKLESGELKVSHCGNPECFVGDEDGDNPHCICGETIINWDPRFSNDDPLRWEFDTKFGCWSNKISGKVLKRKPLCLLDVGLDGSLSSKTQYDVGNLVYEELTELPETKLKSKMDLLGAKDDSSILWDNLTLRNWNTLVTQSEVDVLKTVSSYDFSTKFWNQVDIHFHKKKRKMEIEGKFLSPIQMEILQRVARKSVLLSSIDNKNPIDYIIYDPEIQRHFPKQCRVTNDEFSTSFKYRNMVKASFIATCQSAINGNLENGEIERKLFYKQLLNSALKHGNDFRKGSNIVRFAGGMSVPGRDFSPEKGIFLCVAYEEIARQAESKIQVMV